MPVNKHLKRTAEPALIRKWKEWPAWNRWVVGICTFLFVISVFSPTPPPEQLTPEQLRKQVVESKFSAWDGSHINLTAEVKSRLRDPDSYEHVKTEYWDLEDHLIINMHYRSNNAFGAKAQGFAKAKVGLDGNIIKLLDHR